MKDGITSASIEDLYARLVNCTGGDYMVRGAARGSESKQETNLSQEDKQILRKLINMNNLSIFEHSYLTFIVQCPIYVKNKIQRHRSFCYNEVNREYKNEEVRFYIPEKFYVDGQNGREVLKDKDHDEVCHLMEYYYLQNMELHRIMIGKGIIKDDIRCVLPISILCRFYMSGNFRNFMEFLNVRMQPDTQVEIKKISKGIFKNLLLTHPISVGIWAKKFFGDDVNKELGII